MAGEKLIREAIEAARAAMARGALPPAENSRLTQIATTGPSYDKALRHLERAGIEGRAIDYGAGRGHGLRSIGADTFEPYPQGWTPTFTKPEDIPDDVYRRLVNLNVLNVLDPEARQSAVLNMGRVVEPGGGGVISTRGRDVMAARGEPGPEPMSLIIGEGDSARYQKGFTPRELREYVGDTLGPRFDVEPSDVGAASIMFRRNREDGGAVDFNDTPNYALDNDAAFFDMSRVFPPAPGQKLTNRAENIPLTRSFGPAQPEAVDRALDVVRSEPRPMDIRVSRQAPPPPRPVPRPAPVRALAAPDTSESRRLWEIYNETGNPADFVRASNAMRAGRAEGGRLLEDQYPTQYLPNVGRQVMADGGETAQSRRRATLEQLGSFEDRPVMDPATMGENWANAVRRFRENPVRPGEATVRPLELGGRDVLGGAIAGDGGIVRSRIADIVAGSRGLPGSGTLGFGLADFTPAGVPLAVSDFSDAVRNEDYLSAGLTAALPAAYFARKPIMAAGRAVYDAGARAVDTARDVLGRVPAPVAAGGAGAAVMTPEEAEAGKADIVRRGLEAVTRTNPPPLPRSMTLDEVRRTFDPQAGVGMSPREIDLLTDAYSKVASPAMMDPELAQRGQEIAQGYITKRGSGYGGRSFFNQKPSVPLEELGRATTSIPVSSELRPIVEKSWQEVARERQGSPVITLGGDLSDWNRIVGYGPRDNLYALSRPSDIHAGFDYMREPNPYTVWANNLEHAAVLDKKVQQQKDILRAVDKDLPIMATAAPMGPQSIDSAKNMMDMLLSAIEGRGIHPEYLKDATAYLKSGAFGNTPKAKEAYKKKMEGFPGFEKPEEARQFLLNNPEIAGTVRGDIVKGLERKDWVKKGFPEIGQLRYAASSPQFGLAAGNLMGGRMVEIDPALFGRAMKDKMFSHMTYPGDTFGRYYADVPLVHRQYGAPDAMDELMVKYNQWRPGAKKSDPPKPPITVHPFSLQQSGRDTVRKMFEEQRMVQRINERMLESIERGEQRRPLYGFKDGGNVANHAINLAREINSSPREETVP